MQKKPLTNTQHPFMIEALGKLGTEGPDLSVVKAICVKPAANI
jgi:hypothetical protein